MSTFGWVERSIVILLILSVIIGNVFGCSGGGCPYGEFECNDGKSCYTEDQKCDNKKDCADNTDEDEHHCGNFLIQAKHFIKYQNEFDSFKIRNAFQIQWINFSDRGKWPTFKDIDCERIPNQTDKDKYTLCYEVDYPGDGGKDYMLLEKVLGAFETYSGIMKEEQLEKVAFNLPDKEDNETMAGVSIHKI